MEKGLYIELLYPKSYFVQNFILIGLLFFFINAELSG